MCGIDYRHHGGTMPISTLATSTTNRKWDGSNKKASPVIQKIKQKLVNNFKSNPEDYHSNCNYIIIPLYQHMKNFHPSLI